MTTDAITDLTARLERGGLKEGLLFLNERVTHRFTAVYRLVNGVMRGVELIDKQNDLDNSALMEFPLEHSFCQFAMRDGQFLTGDSGADPRIEDHIYKGVVNSYVGLPLSRTGEDLFGTFCHFDFPPLPVPEEEYAYLARAARVLPRYIPR